MRIKIDFEVSNSKLPIINQHIINTYIHKILGVNNEYHDSKNNYSISNLIGGKLINNEIVYENKAYLIISSLDMTFMNKVLLNFLSSTSVLSDGFKFKNITPINEEFFNGWNHFVCLSPFLIKEYSDKKIYNFLTLDDDNFVGKVKAYLINKLSKIDNTLDLSDFDVMIPDHKNHRTMLIMVKNVKNVANLCHISINTNKKVAELLYNIGIGQSTGSGFGVIYKSENKNLYR